MAVTSAAAGLLGRQLKLMQQGHDIPGVSVGLVGDSVFEWEVMLMMSDDCKYYGGAYRRLFTYTSTKHNAGGFFRTRLSFPHDYPMMPPKMKIETPIFHPNGKDLPIVCNKVDPTVVYANGDVCISILHPPEDDKYGYESASERWSPVQTPETILLSVISMLSSPNDESPANVDAAKTLREDPKEFKRRCRKVVRESLGDE